jgi:hypothetical protein
MTRTRVGSQGSFSGQVIEKITSTETLSRGDSGKVFLLDSAGGAYTITLPNVAKSAGCNFKFVNNEDTPTGDITIAAEGTLVYGTLQQASITNEDSLLDCIDKTNVLFDTTSLLGDWVEYLCDGTYWYVNGVTQLQGGFTVS